MERAKSVTNGNGRNSKGRFVKGNCCAVGNRSTDFVKKARELKTALVNAVTEQDIKDITKKLIAQAKRGNIAAIKELYDRIFGKAPQQIGLDEDSKSDFKDFITWLVSRNGHDSDN